MSQFKIAVDMADVGAQAGAIINAAVLPRLNQAVRAVVTATQANWAEAVHRARLWQGEKDAYATSIQAKMTGDFEGLVWSDYKYAREIDEGRPARDMKKYLDTSQKVRRTKDGRRFLIIPFRHGTPGSTAHAPAMPTEVYDAAKLLKSSKIVGQGQRAAGEVTSVHHRWGTQALGKKHQTPFLMDRATRQHVMVPRNIYQLGEKLAGLPKALSRYEGMVKTGSAKHTQYMTFRIMMEGQTGWIIPPQPGQRIVAGVVERMQPLAERAFAEALKRGG